MKIELLSKYDGDTKVYRVTGTPTNPKWLVNLKCEPEKAWCDVHVWKGEHITGFGGEVWTNAWPELFGPPPRNNWACGTGSVTQAFKDRVAHLTIA